jgi:pyrroline-5-carboxylate reductase
MSRREARVHGYPSRMQLGILGGGRMGEALAIGLVDAGWDPETIVIAEVDADRRHAVEARLPGVRVVPSPSWAAAEAAVVVVAVKPADVVPALTSCIDAVREGALVLSIAAGVTIGVIEAALPGHPVVRAMPNTGALVGCAASAIAAGVHVTEGDLELAERVLGSVGLVVRVSEPQLDAVTGLSGSGPAYLFLVAEAMIEAGVLMGLTRDTAAALVRQTMLGAATLLGDGSEGPEALRAAVTSPGGTTAAGLRVLEACGVRAAFLEAVEAATERSELLGRDS